jgi:hypothetical protein
MAAWSDDDLKTLARIGEIRIAGRRDDGTLRPLVIIWHVVVEGVARNWTGAISWNGQTRDVTYMLDSSHDDEIDDGYFAKYGRGASSQSITSAAAKETTMRIEPAS